MIKPTCLVLALALRAVAAHGQAIDPHPLSLEAIAARNAKALSHDEVLQIVSGAKVNWAAFAGGERIWTNRVDGTVSGTRLGTGVGSFNPHHKYARGKWVVRDDGTFCADLDYGHMMTEGWCWQFFAADGQILMHLTPEVAGAKISFDH